MDFNYFVGYCFGDFLLKQKDKFIHDIAYSTCSSTGASYTTCC